MKYINEWNNNEFSEHLSKFTSIKEKVLISKIAGEGNMNFTYRLSLSENKTVIIKQSPSFCAKFPTIPAPPKRIFSEKTYFELANTSEKLAKSTPDLLGFDPDLNILYMEDLGEGQDFENIYSCNADSITDAQLEHLVLYLKDI